MFSSTHKNMRLLYHLRHCAIAGQLITIAFVSVILHIPLPLFPLLLIISISAALNGYTHWLLRHRPDISDTMILWQLLVDIVALCGLLYFTGGATNPFASLFILQVVFAAVTLPARQVWCVTILTILCYTALMRWNIEMPYLQHHHIGGFFNLHVQGMWISFLLLAVIIAGCVMYMNQIIRTQQSLLAQSETMARLATFATHAAHHLGTPLATIAALSEQCPAPLSGKIQTQLTRCKMLLTQITDSGGAARAEDCTPITLAAFFDDVLKEWRIHRPDAVLDVTLPHTSSPLLLIERGFYDALLNLLNNAADASPHNIRFTAQWDDAHLTIDIYDKGEGIAPSIRETLGTIGVTNKPEGLGLGLFLSKYTICRLGGTLQLMPHEEGGTHTQITLPLKGLTL